MVLRETLVLAVAGIAIGIPAALSLSRILDRALAPAWTDSFAYGLKPNDPSTIAAAVLVLAVVGAAAGYFPARRASRVDPAVALRNE
jgi:ABC-type antimicrobial peptide transport system permease subunit